MRIVTIPYFYLPSRQLITIRLSCIRLLGIIHDIHHDIPNKDWNLKFLDVYLYHPSFLRWAYVKSRNELARRTNCKSSKLDLRFVKLRSRKLSDFVPPNDRDLAEDVVWLLKSWQKYYDKTGAKIPKNYIEVMQKHYDYEPKEEASKRIDELSGRHRDADRGWYQCQGEEASEVCDNSLDSDLRRSGYE